MRGPEGGEKGVGPILAAGDAEIAETGLDLGFKGGSLRLTESFTSSDRRLFIHKGHDAIIDVDADKTVDWNGTTHNFGRLNDDGEATVWEALVPLEADQSSAVFRIALEVDENDAP